MREVYVVNCCRTAIGSFGGSLKDVPAADLGAAVIKEALNRAGVYSFSKRKAAMHVIARNPTAPKIPLKQL